jgi:chitinase
VNDALDEPDETVLLTLGSPTGGAAIGVQATATLTIVDDDAPGLSISDATVAEGDMGTGALTFTVTLSPPSSVLVTVPFTIANGTTSPATGGAACGPNVDFVNASGTLTFQSNDTSETISVAVCADTATEANETLLVNLGTPTGGVAVADGQGVGTILDDDGAGTLSFGVASVQVPENAGSVTLTVQRGGVGPAGLGATGTGPAPAPATGSVPSGSVRPNPAPGAPGSGTVAPRALVPATVSFTTADQTARAGEDYVATTGTLAFGANETTGTITIPILTDGLQEGPESFLVTLSAPTGGAGLGAQATATVVVVDTSHGAAGSPGDDSADDEREERERETEEERRQRERTNRGNKDDDSVEGDVLEAHCDAIWPYVVIANRDGAVEVRLIKEAQAACSSISVGDYLEAGGEKQHEGLFYADSVDVKRRR